MRPELTLPYKIKPGYENAMNRLESCVIRDAPIKKHRNPLSYQPLWTNHDEKDLTLSVIFVRITHCAC